MIAERRMARIGSVLVLGLGVLLCACGPHGFFTFKNRYDVSSLRADTATSPHDRKVFVTKASIDRSAYEPIADLDVTKVWYGSAEAVLDSLANMCRDVGGDAVIESEVWFKPAGWSWASPQGRGRAVKLTVDPKVALEGRPGSYR